jgi:hypothetical protein
MNAQIFDFNQFGNDVITGFYSSYIERQAKVNKTVKKKNTWNVISKSKKVAHATKGI